MWYKFEEDEPITHCADCPCVEYLYAEDGECNDCRCNLDAEMSLNYSRPSWCPLIEIKGEPIESQAYAHDLTGTEIMRICNENYSEHNTLDCGVRQEES